MTTRPGGCCPMCDTVYDRPHECVGIKQEPTEKQLKIAQAQWSVLQKEIWNEAIEAAIKNCLFETDVARIRKLKK